MTVKAGFAFTHGDWLPAAANQRRRRRFVASLVLYLTVLATSAWGQTQQFWPEVDTYVHLNPQARLFFSAQNTREESATSEMDLGAHIDLFLRPLNDKRLLASRPHDEVKSRYLQFRVGYHYIFYPDGSDKPENRIIIEATPRYPVRFGIVLANRNRTDLRFLPGGFAWRYRNRLAVERTFHVHSYRFDPYLRGEVWYDSQYNKWSRTLFQVGAEFPIRKPVSLEGYYEHQNNTSKPPNQQFNGVGLILNLRF